MNNINSCLVFLEVGKFKKKGTGLVSGENLLPGSWSDSRLLPVSSHGGKGEGQGSPLESFFFFSCRLHTQGEAQHRA